MWIDKLKKVFSFTRRRNYVRQAIGVVFYNALSQLWLRLPAQAAGPGCRPRLPRFPPISRVRSTFLECGLLFQTAAGIRTSGWYLAWRTWQPTSTSGSLFSTTKKAKQRKKRERAIEVVRWQIYRFFQIQGMSKRSIYSIAPRVGCPAAWQAYLLTSFTSTERKQTERQQRLSPPVKNLTGRLPILNLCSTSPLLKRHLMKSMNLVGQL